VPWTWLRERKRAGRICSVQEDGGGEEAEGEDGRGARRDALKRREDRERLNWTGRLWIRVDVERYIWKEKRGREGPGARAGDGRRATTGDDGRWAMGGFPVARVWVLVCWWWIALMAPELLSGLVCFVV
jgi:hypothetical protein